MHAAADQTPANCGPAAADCANRARGHAGRKANVSNSDHAAAAQASGARASIHCAVIRTNDAERAPVDRSRKRKATHSNSDGANTSAAIGHRAAGCSPSYDAYITPTASCDAGYCTARIAFHHSNDTATATGARSIGAHAVAAAANAAGAKAAARCPVVTTLEGGLSSAAVAGRHTTAEIGFAPAAAVIPANRPIDADQ